MWGLKILPKGRIKTLWTNYFKCSALLNRKVTLLLPLILPFFAPSKLSNVVIKEIKFLLS